MSGCNHSFVTQTFLIENKEVTVLLGNGNKMPSKVNQTDAYIEAVNIQSGNFELDFCEFALGGCNCCLFRQKLTMEN